ncbi:MAG: hypothetical protein QOD72_3413 [Acidimicrobiaceae bacterium]|nr:hypothetical protein [Acidimicrobiaceae bacterium]
MRGRIGRIGRSSRSREDRSPTPGCIAGTSAQTDRQTSSSSYVLMFSYPSLTVRNVTRPGNLSPQARLWACAILLPLTPRLCRRSAAGWYSSMDERSPTSDGSDQMTSPTQAWCMTIAAISRTSRSQSSTPRSSASRAAAPARPPAQRLFMCCPIAIMAARSSTRVVVSIVGFLKGYATWRRNGRDRQRGSRHVDMGGKRRPSVISRQVLSSFHMTPVIGSTREHPPRTSANKPGDPD